MKQNRDRGENKINLKLTLGFHSLGLHYATLFSFPSGLRLLVGYIWVYSVKSDDKTISILYENHMEDGLQVKTKDKMRSRLIFFFNKFYHHTHILKIKVENTIFKTNFYYEKTMIIERIYLIFF